jgi:hypothetical protein
LLNVDRGRDRAIEFVGAGGAMEFLDLKTPVILYEEEEGRVI